MTGKLPNRIASEDLQNCTSWALPQIGERGKILASAEKEAKDRRSKRGEIIEDVDADAMTFSPLTANELQAITYAAEKDGFEKGRQAGFDQGQSEGNKKGYDEGMALAQTEVAAQVARVLQVAEALVEPINSQDRALEKLLLEYVSTLTRQLVRRELQTDSSDILRVVQTALAALPVGAKNLKIHLNPDDLALIESYAQEQQKDWSFIGDSRLIAGGCRIESAESLVDYSVDIRLDEMLHQFADRQLADAGGDDNLDGHSPDSER